MFIFDDILFDGSGLIPNAISFMEVMFGKIIFYGLPLIFGVVLVYWILRHLNQVIGIGQIDSGDDYGSDVGGEINRPMDW